MLFRSRQVLSSLAEGLEGLSALGLELADPLSGRNVVVPAAGGRPKLFGVAAAEAPAAVPAADGPPPLCLPERSFRVGRTGAVWAYRDIVYLMVRARARARVCVHPCLRACVCMCLCVL